MSFVAELPLIGGVLSTVVPFLLMLAVVVFVHEYGHYIVGRWCGIGAEAFSVGFGKEIYGWTDKRGTRWKISILPLGGYVKFIGDADVSSSSVDEAKLAGMNASERQTSFPLASVERRAATVLAGPVANFILSIVIFAMMALWQGSASEEPVIGEIGADVNPEFAEALAPGDRVLSVGGAEVETFADFQTALSDQDGETLPVRVERGGAERDVTVVFRAPARVDGLTPGGAAERAGVEMDDVIVGVNGEAISGFAELQRLTRESGGAPMALSLRRGDEIVEVVAEPTLIGDEQRPVLGVQKQMREVAPEIGSVGPLAAIGVGVDRTWTVIALSLDGLSQVIVGEQEAEEVLGGPIRIAQLSGDAAEAGIGVFIGLIAVLSASIGMINLFPIPVLDGGHLVFYAIEKLRGEPLRARWQEVGNTIGLALVLLLMAYATFNDIARL